MNNCLKCGASATAETANTENPRCWAHGGLCPEEIQELDRIEQEIERELDDLDDVDAGAWEDDFDFGPELKEPNNELE